MQRRVHIRRITDVISKRRMHLTVSAGLTYRLLYQCSSGFPQRFRDPKESLGELDL
jgi:hypothetical protein